MNATQSSKLTMYLTVQEVLATHQDVWSALPGFAAGVETLEEGIAAIQSQVQIQLSKTGAGAEKAAAFQTLVDAAYEVAAAVHAGAVANNNQDLAGRVDFSRSDVGRGRDSAVLARCQDILAAATENLPALADYGLTAAKLTALRKKIETFQALLVKPRKGRVTSGAATQALPKLFKRLDELLGDRLDRLAVQFKTSQPGFFNAYTGARLIVDRPGGHAGKAAAAATPATTSLSKAA